MPNPPVGALEHNVPVGAVSASGVPVGAVSTLGVPLGGLGADVPELPAKANALLVTFADDVEGK